MIEQLLDATAAAPFHEVNQRQFMHQIMKSPAEEIMLVAHKALNQPDALRQALAIQLLYELGYPTNAPAIPGLIIHLGDPDRPGWDTAVKTLVAMDLNVVVPHLILALLDRKNVVDVNGICMMLDIVDPEFSCRCCPAINYLLCQENLAEVTYIDFDALLDVVERAGNEQTYVLPALLKLQKTTKRSSLKEHIRRILATFPDEVVASYALYTSSDFF